MLNIVWSFFFLASVIMAAWRLLQGDAAGVSAVMRAVFDSSKEAFDIALGLTGVMTFWLGVLRVGERAGVLTALVRWLRPLFSRLFPGVPAQHPALGAMTLNLAANMLGLDNAATPAGLKAMQELQTLNRSPERATDAQALFMVLNTASVTLFPVTILMFRAQLGAHDPADVYVPILISTLSGFLIGLVVTALVQRIRLTDVVLMAWIGGLALVAAALVVWLTRLPASVMLRESALLADGLLLALIAVFVVLALARGIDVYAAFIDGAKEGFTTAISIIAPLTAMLVAIGVFRACGALDMLENGLRHLAASLGLDTRWVDAVPVALMKPLSGSGARAMMLDTMRHYGADSLAGRMACVIQGSTETTFYVLAVYFGSVGVRRARHALPCALLADLSAMGVAIWVSLRFFS